MRNLVISVLLVLWSTATLAHSPLESTAPLDGDTMSAAPSEVKLDFHGDIRLTRVSMTHANTHSEDLDLGTQKAFAQEFVLPMTDMGAGTYLIEWRGLGKDGHTLNGSFGFVVE